MINGLFGTSYLLADIKSLSSKADSNRFSGDDSEAD